jgi:hypothetical protein
MKYKVTVDFSLNDNSYLTSLEGCPEEVLGSFLCRDLGITNLIGAPKKIGMSFYVNDCIKLVSLEGMPLEIGDSLGIHGCTELTSFKYCPEIINGNFIISYFPKITSLEYFPKVVKGNIISYGDPLQFTEEQLRSVCDFGYLRQA